MRRFNTAGPCRPDWHYMLPAAERLPEARRLIEQHSYFVLHAPRQTGKTTSLRALARELTDEGRFAALHFSCEAGSVGDVTAAQQAIASSIVRAAQNTLPPELHPPSPWPVTFEPTLLSDGLAVWAHTCPRPLVLFFDEIDALHGDALISVLKQLRSGYSDRPENFPSSVVLCGLRDVRDYKVASGGEGRLGTSSPFNVKVESQRLDNFTQDEVRRLYVQHTEATGQVFEPEAIERAWEYTQGQPWLVNALAREIVEELKIPGPIGAAHVSEAKERLILARATHLDSLVARLLEPRVRRIIEPMIAGTQFTPADPTYDDDLSFVYDLGLVELRPSLRIANPIYREVIVRVLAATTEVVIRAEPRSFVRPDGTFDLPKLLVEFTSFWKEHEPFIDERLPYAEASAQIVLMAFLTRLVNGGGYIDREYGIGRGRIDLLVRWPWRDANGQSQLQREALELKVWRDGRPDPLDEGLGQLDGYLEGLGLGEGVLVLFDRRSTRRPVTERIESFPTTTTGGRRVTVWRM